MDYYGCSVLKSDALYLQITIKDKYEHDSKHESHCIRCGN